jgi:hypothetical protein
MKSTGGRVGNFLCYACVVVGCEGGSVEKCQVWNGNGCGGILESPPPVCVLGIGDLNEIVCGRESVWVQRVVYGGKQFQWAMEGGIGFTLGGGVVVLS